MSKSVPFVANIKIIPDRPSKRQELFQSLSKISSLIYDALLSESSINMATPGGGVSPSFGDINHRYAFGNYSNGLAVKPQIGDTPAQLVINGFYTSSSDNDQIWPTHQVISGGRTFTGYSSNSAVTVPSTTFNAEVKIFHDLLDTIVNTSIPDGVSYEIYRLEYSGIVFGEKGFSYPR